MSELGRRLKKLREDNLLSRKQFAGILECSVSHAINIEKGNSGLSDEKAKKLTEHFGLSEDFFSVKEEAPRSVDPQDFQIGQNIRTLRKQMNLTQTELAEEVGYSGSATICAIESGQRSVGKKKLVVIADFFDVHVAELLRNKSASFSKEIETQKLITDFYFILEAKKKPAIFDLLVKLIEEGCEEIRNRG